jgi:hypothetical protein
MKIKDILNLWKTPTTVRIEQASDPNVEINPWCVILESTSEVVWRFETLTSAVNFCTNSGFEIK